LDQERRMDKIMLPQDILLQDYRMYVNIS